MKKIGMILAVAITAGAPAVVSAQQPTMVEGKALGLGGQSFGKVRFTQVPEGVRIEADLVDLPPGVHGLHIHDIGRCYPPNRFFSSGDHVAAANTSHGTLVTGGPHLGDLPNQTVNAEGKLHLDLIAPKLTLQATGPTGLLDADESALVIDEKADDNRSQPYGAGGDHIACAIIGRSN